MIDTLPSEIMDMIVDGLSPQDMARAAASHRCLRASVERVVVMRTAAIGRLGSCGGAALAPSAGEGWACVALYAAQLQELPLGGGSDPEQSTENFNNPAFPAPSDCGDMRDHGSYLCTSNPELVFAEFSYGAFGGSPGYKRVYGVDDGPSLSSRISLATKEIQDLCHDAADDVGPQYGNREEDRNPIWKPRLLPLSCDACNVVCATYEDFYAHCLLISHRQAVDSDGPLPLWSIDPRLRADADTTPLMVLHQQVSSWHAHVLTVLRTDDSAYPDGWEDLADWARECFEKDYPAEDVSNSGLVFDNDTAFRAISENFVVQDFLDHGIWPGDNGGGYHMQIVRDNGYDGGFEFAGSSSSRMFLGFMTEGRCY